MRFRRFMPKADGVKLRQRTPTFLPGEGAVRRLTEDLRAGRLPGVIRRPGRGPALP